MRLILEIAGGVVLGLDIVIINAFVFHVFYRAWKDS